MGLEPVLHVWINHDHDLVDLTLTARTPATHGKPAVQTSEVIHTNKKHPFLTEEKGFLPVGQVKLDMHVRRADGSYGVVTGWKVVPGTQVMYNLEVAQDHTFTVGTGQWVVHNSGGVSCGGGGPDFNQAAEDIKADYNLSSPYHDTELDTSKWKLVDVSDANLNDDPRLTDAGFTERYYFKFSVPRRGIVKVSADYDPTTGAWNDSIGKGFHLSSDQESDFWQQEADNQ